jgi:cytochrome c551/c552
MPRVARLVVPTVFLALVACGCPEPASDAAWVRTARADLPDAAKAQVGKALGSRDVLFQALSGRLVAAMQEGGPAAAIDVCRSEAAAISERVAGEQGVRIGRTSHRLRNPENAPPAWAKEAVAEQAGENAWFVHADGRLAGLLPIRLQNACVGCHGDADAMPGPVREAIAAAYPDDEATGFAAGDLRGWVWVEVPAP